MGILEKIKQIEGDGPEQVDLIYLDGSLCLTNRLTAQKNKATEYHLGLLKAKLARYRAQLLEPAAKSSGGGTGFEVQKSGDARIALIGFPSVGKSTLLSKTTHTQSEAAAYEFTTLTAIPGVIEYKGARIQLLDLPGIVEGASQGRGRGRQVVATAKTADLIVVVLDATKSEEQKRLLEIELDAIGIRLNKSKPDVVFKKKTTGGITLNTTVKLTKTDEKTIRTILAGYKIHNCDVMIREDITTDEFIDVLIGGLFNVFARKTSNQSLVGTRKYMPCLYVYNKIDAISLEQVDKLARQPNTVVISCEMDLNLDYLIDRMWEKLQLVKVYTKKRGEHPDLSDPICLRKGATIEDVCNGVHRSLAPNFRYALVWYKTKMSCQSSRSSVNYFGYNAEGELHIEFEYLSVCFTAQLSEEFPAAHPVAAVGRVPAQAEDKSKGRRTAGAVSEVQRGPSSRLRDRSPYPESDVEVIFLGTGTSSSLPHIECLTEPADSAKPPCRTCLSTLQPEGKKNIRRNTGAVFRLKGKDGNLVYAQFDAHDREAKSHPSRTIVVDAGKTFQAAALEWFPKHRLRRIDALLLTHPHADAMNGLDDLRDIYASEHTFIEVQRAFPYLVAKEFASGGGDVPEFKWHIINDQKPFEIGETGITVLPFAVHHGRFFSRVPPPSYIVTPNATLPSTPKVEFGDLPISRSNSLSKATTLLQVNDDSQADDKEKIYPYLCFGFKIEGRLAYISDTSYIPDHVWRLLEPRRTSGGGEERLPVLILDCLRLRPHTSHLGLEQAISATRRVNALRTYLTGFSHDVSHEEYVKLGEIVGGAEYNPDTLTDNEKAGLALLGDGGKLWVRPAHDGLRISIKASDVSDTTYQ
ncbi:hypothetical protein NMY22_g1220 [Coprinellus aureogranulatus]|nr:hypothetical protein NMY22_g1220 [Coprinellus aureogranulatus]